MLYSTSIEAAVVFESYCVGPVGHAESKSRLWEFHVLLQRFPDKPPP